MCYKIRKYTPKDFHGFAELLIQNFAIENTDKKAGIQWKFFNSPETAERITYLATWNNHIVAQYTNMPFIIQKSEKIYKSMICADMVTDHKHRGKGLISLLSKKVYEEVKEKSYDFSIGFSNDSGILIDKHAKGYGYRIVGKMYRYAKFILSPHEPTFTLIEVSHFEELKKMEQINMFSITKSLQYLIWRYQMKPNNQYHIYKIIDKDKKHLGYTIISIKTSGLYCYDIILDKYDDATMKSTILSLEVIAKQYKKRFIIFNVLKNTYWEKMFKDLHYIKKLYSKKNYYVTIKIHKQLKEENEILDKQNWFVITGDIL